MLVGGLVASVFVVMLLAVSAVREAERREARSKDITVATLGLEKLVLDMQAGVRGFVNTRKERFLTPMTTARRELPQQFERARAPGGGQSGTAPPGPQRVGHAINDYRDIYAIPMVRIARGPAPAAA